ncbi:MAG: SRPBCC family protein [Rhodobacteraceae bacterium]|nr:SRPBCC family protein [Paracoccaceae bacterium]
MKFSHRVDIGAPDEAVFRALTDFTAFERAAMRRGAEVIRSSPGAAITQGTSWSLRFSYRGKMRRLVCSLDRLTPQSGFLCRLESTGFDGTLSADIIPLSKARSRLTVQLELKPQSFKARLLLQSARLNRAAYARKFETRVAGFAEEVERRQT